mgnify:CR=1 FL=1
MTVAQTARDGHETTGPVAERRHFVGFEALRAVAARVGMEAPAFEACLKNKAAYDVLKKNRSDALEKGVIVAPTFVVGDRRHVGIATLDELERLIVAGQAKAP